MKRRSASIRTGGWEEEREEGRTVHRVLNGSSSEEKSVSTVESEEGLPSRRRRTLDSLSLVEDHVLPLDSLEVLLVRHDLRKRRVDQQSSFDEKRNDEREGTNQLITRDQNMERSVLVVTDLFPVPELPECRSILDVSPVRKTLELRDESSDLLLPVVKRRSGSDDEEGSPDVVDFGEVGHERDRLDSLREEGRGKRGRHRGQLEVASRFVRLESFVFKHEPFPNPSRRPRSR